MLYVLIAILCAGVGTRFGYYLKEKEIEEGSLVEALVPEELEKGINRSIRIINISKRIWIKEVTIS